MYSVENNRFPFSRFPGLYVEILSESVQSFVGFGVTLYGNVGYSTTPEYAQISDLVGAFPQLAGKGPLRILIGAVAKGQAPFWGFVTVTNNDTQQVTTITPQ